LSGVGTSQRKVQGLESGHPHGPHHRFGKGGRKQAVHGPKLRQRIAEHIAYPFHQVKEPPAAHGEILIFEVDESDPASFRRRPEFPKHCSHRSFSEPHP
jgi:hypothetical protein